MNDYLTHARNERNKALNQLLREACEEDNTNVIEFLMRCEDKKRLDLSFGLKMAEASGSRQATKLLLKAIN